MVARTCLFFALGSFSSFFTLLEPCAGLIFFNILVGISLLRCSGVNERAGKFNVFAVVPIGWGVGVHERGTGVFVC